MFMGLLCKEEGLEGKYMFFTQLCNIEGIYQRNEEELKMKLMKA